MKQQIVYALLAASASALPTVSRRQTKREVPQEHAHQNVIDIVNPALQLNNPDNIQDAVFGLLGAKAAAEGAGNIADADCLQQATADQAFTNAKAAGDVNSQTFALIYRALERNSGSVGAASPPCTSIQAVNPEIAALQQHQDPAGDGAQALNKQIATTLAQQIQSIGGNASLANEASTFAPGQLGDPTAKGNSCDVADDKAGCINSQNLRVDDLSADEITAAIAGVSAGSVAASNSSAVAAGNAAASASACAATAAAATAASAAAATAAAAASGSANAAAAGAANFGTCSNLDINFGIPSDRDADAFFSADQTNFPHGSALNIAVITGFECTQLVNKCGANQAAVDACNSAAQAATGLSGQQAADAFNSAIAAA